MTKDFEVTVKVRNNRLLVKMRESGFVTAKDLAVASGVSQQGIGAVLTMKRPGKAKFNGVWRPTVQKLADFFGCMPEEIVPEAVREHPLAKNTAKFTIDGADVQDLIESLRTVALPADDHLDQQELKARVDEALRSLDPREERVLRLRFGIGADEHTLEAIADKWGLHKERIRQIEGKALRKLKRPSRSRLLREALPEWEPFKPKPKRREVRPLSSLPPQLSEAPNVGAERSGPQWSSSNGAVNVTR